MEDNKTSSETTFQNALDIFETLNQNFPLTSAAKVIGKKYNEDGSLKTLVVKVMFSKTNLQKFESRVHSNIYSLDVQSGISTQLNDIPLDEPSDKFVVVKSEKEDQKVIIRKDTKNEKLLYLEHWDLDGLSTSLKLNNISKIHNNSVFGGISWSKNKDKIVFIAEREDVTDYTPYWDSENKKPKDEKSKGENEKKTIHISDKFKYNHQNSNLHSNYGETLAEYKYTVVVVYDLVKKKTTILNLMKMKSDNKIDSDIFDDIHPAHPLFDESGEGLIFQGYHLPIDKLGLVFCINRPTKLFYMKKYEEPESPKDESKEAAQSEDQKKEEEKNDQPKFKYDVEILTKDYYFAAFPKFTTDYKYLSFFWTKDEFHTHSTSLELSVFENFGSSDMTIKTIIEREHEMNDLFSGIYGDSTSQTSSSFLKNTHTLLISTVNKGKEISLTVDVSNGQLKVIKNDEFSKDTTFWALLIHEDIVLFKTDSIKERPTVYFVKGIDTENPEWIKLAQVDTQSKVTERCKEINDQLKSIKIDSFSLDNGAEGYFVQIY